MSKPDAHTRRENIPERSGDAAAGRPSCPDLLMVFLKNPEPGHVKTRLAEGVGEGKALEIYRRLLEHTRAVCLELEVDRQAWYSRQADPPEGWDEPLFSGRLQEGGDLGSRMSYAFREAVRSGYRRVAIIGSDCADLRTHHLRQAFRLLEKRELVLGPASDGGYYLLGATAWHPELFRGIDWSTGKVLGQTRTAAARLGLPVAELPVLGDVDNEADWHAARRRNAFLQ